MLKVESIVLQKFSKNQIYVFNIIQPTPYKKALR
jgi:hypothetical protein